MGSGEYEREALGVVLGGVPALLLEHRFVRYSPQLMIALAMLWSVFIIPYLTQRHRGTEKN